MPSHPSCPTGKSFSDPLDLMLNDKKRAELLGLSLLALGVFTLLSLIPVGTVPRGDGVFAAGNIMGVLGRWFATAAVGVFGVGAAMIPAGFGLAGAASFGWVKRESATHWIALLI